MKWERFLHFCKQSITESIRGKEIYRLSNDHHISNQTLIIVFEPEDDLHMSNLERCFQQSQICKIQELKIPS